MVKSLWDSTAKLLLKLLALSNSQKNFLSFLVGCLVFTGVFYVAKDTKIGAFQSNAQNSSRSGEIVQKITEVAPASVFFVPSVDADDLKVKYKSATTTGNKIRILIVPGHEPDFGGTEYKGVKERDLAVEIGANLKGYLSQNSRFELFTTRDKDAWNPDLQKIFDTRWEDIKNFRSMKKDVMKSLINEGKVTKEKTSPANDAREDVAIRLYGINMWANENKIDIMIHIHLNDYPRRSLSKAGEYSGFSIYVPESQYSNAKATQEIAQSVFHQLSLYVPWSNLPTEIDGVIEDQELVAIGSNNTADAASMLIEYAYIYEPHIMGKTVRSKALKELAFRTYIGIQDFFDDTSKIEKKYDTTLLPYTWKKPVEYGAKDSLDALSLQAALIIQGVFPPAGISKNDCSLSGGFGPCTREALKAFQIEKKIIGESGVFGSKTRAALNELYSK